MGAPLTTDLKREIPAYRAKPGVFAVVDVPALTYLMLDGHGDPNTAPAYAEALASLYPLAYRLKFLSRNELGRDHVVMPLEALWWSADPASFTRVRDTSRWDWTLMIMVPPWIEEEHVARARVAARAAGAPDRVGEVRLERYEEGLCVQTLHVGPYDAEGAVLAAMHDDFIPAQGLRMTGHHHEVYLSDPRRTAADRLRTILRQPVARL